MNVVKKLAMLLLVVALAGPILGCGIGATPSDHIRMFGRVADNDARMLVDDIALFAQTNRPLRTSRWIID